MNCYNGARYLREALDSVLVQTVTDWELIFWDNRSTDDSAAIFRSYEDPRFRYFLAPRHTSLGEARNLAMRQARGTWAAFLDTDDIWIPVKLSRQLAAVDGTDHVLCYAGCRDINPDGSSIRETLPSYPTGPMLEQQLRQFEINMVTPIVRRSALERHGLTFDGNVTASEEYNLFMRLAANGTFATVPEILGVVRVSSPGSLTESHISKWADERFYTLEQLKRENPGIEERHPAAFKEAYARGHYYKARHLMSSGDRSGARESMRRIRSVDARYFLLWISLFTPWLWHVLHRHGFKRVWLARMWSAVRPK